MSSLAKRVAEKINLVPEESLVDLAYMQIEELIATLQLPPGQMVSENMLSTLIGLGRTPVREALQQLAREGLVVIMPKRGIVVSEIDVKKQLRLLEVRREIERYLVGAAAKRAEPDERVEFARLAKNMRLASQESDGEAFLELDRKFNKLVIKAGRNEYASSVMKLMQGLSRRFWFAYYKRFANLPETAQLHAAIAQHIAEEKPEEAMRDLDVLLDNVETFTRATLD
ncbi:GntR family transcriptional regulator [Pseudomonas agarici]|uniref:GntR family transcriptional regulator n=1 Tax=Pseudomonas agarici TaxID=46677 RepID=A0A0X1T6M2_PSEAA|nr:GntR family transcriptional regulator [Pseudomonas agarici]AMB87780.1 GntR family transcriptional regulator [Pseudomonas agarici]NWB94051.1 GntR family transcriptional regulator [Pseudomonas agarici]NWC11772.1 GntR family transcriptional regulator [Pseudomonas agarici]SEL84944.1 transcriptional regulator, GntR family [Pseudomonas agarici]